jgi:two-component system, NarL family, invasion response regulator UvrY
MMEERLDKIRVGFADDHDFMRSTIRNFVEEHFSVVGEAKDGLEAVRLVQNDSPDILLLDYMMPGLNGVEVLKSLPKENTKTKVLMLTSTIDKDLMREMLNSGARGILIKDDFPIYYQDAITKVHKGEIWLSPTAKANIYTKPLRSFPAE